MRVLLVEDAPGLGEAVREQIADDGHAVDWVQRLEHANNSVRSTPYDLILLDLMLPDGRGLDFLRQQRSAGNVTPVIILTAQDQISDRIAGLNAGADDYLVKPFDLFELSARVAAVARRYSGNPNPQIKLGELQIDMNARTVQRAGVTGRPDGARMGAVRGVRAAPHGAACRSRSSKSACTPSVRKSRATPSRSISAACAKNSGATCWKPCVAWVIG